MSLASPTVNYGSTDSPYGPCLLAVSEERLVYLGFLLPGEEAVPVLTAAGLGPALTRDDKSARCWAGRVFSGEAVPIAPRGTSFQLAVWDALKAIPRGQTRTYSEIAHAVGRPLATRAVGTAIGRNPLAWLIPCHRVIRRDGALGGFRWGLLPARGRGPLPAVVSGVFPDQARQKNSHEGTEARRRACSPVGASRFLPFGRPKRFNRKRGKEGRGYFWPGLAFFPPFLLNHH